MWKATLIVARLLRDQRGATAVEYGLIISLIILAMFAALGNVADATINMWGQVSTKVSSAS